MDAIVAAGMETRTMRAWADRYACAEDFEAHCEKTDAYSEYVVSIATDTDNPETFEDERIVLVTIVRVPVVA